MKRAIFAAITLLGLSSPLIAGPFEDADAAYDKGDYARALRLISPLVDQGNRSRRIMKVFSSTMMRRRSKDS